MKDIIVIVGPTGVGKTKLSIELAKVLDAEIINADSMQVYKYLDIGTAKVKSSEKENIPHHLFDIKDPKEMYTIYDYQKDARKTINDILSRGKKAIIVGGSGLYIKAALYDYNFKEETTTYDFSNMSNEELYKQIINKDKNCNIHIHNRKRLERYLTKLLNESILPVNENKKVYDFDIIGLTTSRDNLYNIINTRVDNMIKDGLIDEVKSLYDKNIYSKSIQTGIGYKELYKYFDTEITLEEAIELIKRNSRRYAKRQYTFFKNKMDIKWFNTDYDDFKNTLQQVLDYLNGNN